MVEADVVDEGAVRVGAQHAGDAAAEADRRVADADGPVAEVPGHGLGDQARRVGEVDDPGVRCQPGHPAGDVDGDRDGPQPVGDAARADRLLAEDALRERHPFVVGASLEAAYADRGEHEVGAAQRLVEVGRRGHRRRVGHPGRLFGQYPGHRRQPGRVQVVQDDVAHASLAAVSEERPVHERYAEPAAAQHRQPHVGTLPSPGRTSARRRSWHGRCLRACTSPFLCPGGGRAPTLGPVTAPATPTAPDRLLAVLAAFDHAHPALSLTDISRRAGLSLTTAHRLVGA